ncbi:MmcQ/YjbR family DNA-binding protein [Catellatospora sp. NPDC049609]|uniref:MmcQ/YjbR family DNA-binding protein n=1 Tax=Catellatospora sp. NPDC049609 TaxID=3155505 RepID=UPI003440DF59
MGVTYEQVRGWVLELPGTGEVMVEEWGHPTLRVGDKMFASGTPGSTVMTVKASKEEQAALLAAAPEVYSVAAYVGRFGWVQVALDRVEADELRELVVEAWRRTAPKKLVKQYDAGA